MAGTKMGVWDEGSFGNDVALDFAAQVKDFADVRRTILKYADQAKNLNAEDAQIALATCDMLAAAIKRPPTDLPDVPDFEAEHVSDSLLRTAAEIVEQIRLNSELARLWAEEDDTQWQKAIEDLSTRLDPSKPYENTPKLQKAEPPEDFLGYCYKCFGMVTEQNGLHFEHTDPDGATSANYPHRSCIEELIPEPGPYWNADGSPTPIAHRQLMRGLGYEV